jgi:NDP-sugar pyrophosphorylase family protein
LRTEPILALNGDSFCDLDLGNFYADQTRRSAPVMMALSQADDVSRYGQVQVEPNGRVVEFREKEGRNGPGWINAGVYLISRQLLAAIPEGKSVSLERELLPNWLRDGVFAFAVNGRFIDIGTPQSLIKAESFFSGSSEAAVA